MPTAVAAFSESRTAKKARPLGLRCSASTASATTPKPISSVQKSEWAVGSVRSIGPAVAFTACPAGPPLSGKDWAKKSWSPTRVKARVTTASWRPRTRSAGMPMIIPIGAVQSAARGTAKKKGSPHLVVKIAVKKAPKPAKVNWQSDTWPTNPVSTTIERKMQPSPNTCAQ